MQITIASWQHTTNYTPDQCRFNIPVTNTMNPNPRKCSYNTNTEKQQYTMNKIRQKKKNNLKQRKCDTWWPEMLNIFYDINDNFIFQSPPKNLVSTTKIHHYLRHKMSIYNNQLMMQTMSPNSVWTSAVHETFSVSVVDLGFESQLGQTNQYAIGICRFSAKHALLRTEKWES